MTFARFTAKKHTLAEIKPMVWSLLSFIEEKVSPSKVFLIGSASRGEYTVYSDLDFVIVLQEGEAFKASSALYIDRPFPEVPVDFLKMTANQFERNSKIGGIAYIAAEDGILLLDKGTKIDPSTW